MNEANVQYCENCGKPLNAKARYCGRCGKPVQPQSPAETAQQPSVPAPPVQQPVAPSPVTQPAPPPLAAGQAGEVIVGALPMCTQKSGFLGMGAKSFVLVLTNMRILVAQQTKELMKENARQAKAGAKQEGKGFFSQWGAVIGSYGSKRYLQMSPQDILGETPGNYFIANSQIRQVRVNETVDPDGYQNETKLRLKTAGGKLEFRFRSGGKRKIKQALQQTLGNVVR